MAIINIILELLCSHLTCGLKLILAQEDHSLSMKFPRSANFHLPPLSHSVCRKRKNFQERKSGRKKEKQRQAGCVYSVRRFEGALVQLAPLPLLSRSLIDANRKFLGPR